MSEQPTGTVTFLFTDIQGSTMLWEKYQEAMQTALARHDELLRRAIEANNGYVFKTVGDEFCAAFTTVPDALNAALAAQRALRDEDWKTCIITVRMALHTGATEERDGDYYGPPVNRVARLLAAGHGGQILLSLAAQELVRDHLPEHVELRDMGTHRLKDLVCPEHVFQVIAPDLPAEFPALKTLDIHPNNLPAQTTVFIGREAEINAVEHALSRPDVRLLTLTGPGGTGKTRLSLQVASEMLEQFADGVFFVPLASVSDPALVVSTILHTLGLDVRNEQSPQDALQTYLTSKQMLLLLDNFEQVVEAATDVHALLRAAPDLTMLVTSRTLLRVSGEHEYPVPPLRLPDPTHLPPLDRLTHYEAVRLFLERAQSVKAGFTVTNQNAPAVAEICAKLDGLPLAIELAAVRVRLLSPDKMLARLDHRLRFLTGGVRDLPIRQRTIRGAIEWSYELLNADEKTLFHRLGIFAGGWTLDAAEAVCAIDDDVDVLNGLESLLDKNLVKQVEVYGELRFVMLETIREYALERMTAYEDVDRLRQQHAHCFLALAEETEPRLYCAQGGIWSKRLEADYGNLRAVLAWSLDHAIEIGLRLAGALGRFWDIRNKCDEGRFWLTKILEDNHAYGAENDPWRAKALQKAGLLARVQGDIVAACSLGEEGVALWRKIGEKRGLGRALSDLALAVLLQGDLPTGRSLQEESMTLLRQTDDTSGLAQALWMYGYGMYYLRHYEHARVSAEECIELAQAIEGTDHIATATSLLGDIAFDQEEYAAAQSLYESSLTLYQEIEGQTGTGFGASHLGDVLYIQGRYTQSERYYAESLEFFRKSGVKTEVAWHLTCLGYTALHHERWQAARTRLTEGLTLHRDHGDTWGSTACLIGFAGIAEKQGQFDRAVPLIHAIDALLDTCTPRLRLIVTSHHLDAAFRAEYDRIVDAVRSALGKESLETAVAKGRTMTLEQAIATATRSCDDRSGRKEHALKQKKRDRGVNRRGDLHI
ncbi:MAG: adenylate/guanylate cyclase domain-containing protein [bacterium]|nr:adenylate/guanylate cyclase domain-containing protein [bacterium]